LQPMSTETTQAEDSNEQGEVITFADLSRSQRDILVATGITEGRDVEANGLEIKSWALGYLGEDINHGTLYPRLDELVEMGLVEKGEIDGRTNEYRVTDKGWHVIADYASVLETALQGNDD